MLEVPDPRFTERSNAFINAANAYLDKVAPSRVSASMMHAAARFHVWLWSLNAANQAEFESRRAEARELFLSESAKMFDEHFDDYTRNFTAYLEQSKGG